MTRTSTAGTGQNPPQVERAFSIDGYDPEGRPLQITGPDGQITLQTYTDRGELEWVSRNGLEAELHYDDAGRLDWIGYANGTGVDYTYDDADRAQQIRHFSGQNDLLVIDYAWTINNWVETRTETDCTVQPPTTTVVSFDYDDRGRLIGETRIVDGTTTVYDLSYTYDQLGNRDTKFDAVTQLETRYTYDVELDPEDMDYPTRNNRLLYYELFDPDFQGGQEPIRTVTYTYWDTGDASNITVKDEDPTGGNDPAYAWHRDLALYYWADHTLRAGLWGQWQVDENGDPIDETYVTDGAREFHYDSYLGGPQERYLAIDYDTPTIPDPNSWVPVEPMAWTDYLGAEPYGDAQIANISNPQVTEEMRYLFPGAQEAVATGETQYYHGDLIGSTMLTTDETGGTAAPAVSYTAFGEVLTANGSPGGSAPEGFPRYQYAGAWDYETGGFGDDPGGPAGSSHLLALYGVNPNLPPITLQHVGHRWYQPDIERFIQRDPIGIEGGLNVYGYCVNAPTRRVDPLGLSAIDIIDDALDIAFTGAGGAFGGIIGIPSGPPGIVIGTGAGGAGGHMVYEGIKQIPSIAVCIWDIGKALYKEHKNAGKNRKERRDNPKLFPPRPVPPIDVPDVPCGHPW